MTLRRKMTFTTIVIVLLVGVVPLLFDQLGYIFQRDATMFTVVKGNVCYWRGGYWKYDLQYNAVNSGRCQMPFSDEGKVCDDGTACLSRICADSTPNDPTPTGRCARFDAGHFCGTTLIKGQRSYEHQCVYNI